jgi:hypothetical protein
MAQTPETFERDQAIAHPGTTATGLDDARQALVTPSETKLQTASGVPPHLDLAHHNLYPQTRRQHGHVAQNGASGSGLAGSAAIKGDGSAQIHPVAQGETLTEIAAKQLGPHASKHDIQAQIAAIVKANPGVIANRDKIFANSVIKLPKFELPGPGREAQAAGGRRQPASGDQGTPRGDRMPSPPRDQATEMQPQPAPSDMATEKRKLLADLDDPAKNKGMSPDQVQQVKADMTLFEARAQATGDMDKDVAQTYQQMSRLLDADPAKSKVGDPKLLSRLVEQIAHQAADPRIDQGNHRTCNVTSIGEVTFTKHPGEAAEAIATTALTGHFRNPADGRVSVIPEGSLQPGREENRDLPGDNQRSYATQLLNLALVNDQTQRRQPPEYYSQEQPERGNQNQSDTGERLRYADGTEVKKAQNILVVDSSGQHRAIVERPARSPNLTCSEIEQIGERLQDGKQIVISNREAAGFDAKEAQPRNAAELQSVLAGKKANGSLPAIILVDANNPEFGAAGRSANGPNWHVLSITNYDPQTGDVTMANQWGKNSHNMHVSVQRLSEMMKPNTANQS